jgi:hypothetical protein
MQTLNRLRPKLLLLLLSFVFTFLFYSCKKTDSFTEPPVQKENLAEKFFETKTPLTKEIAGIIEQLKKENAASNFINKLPANIGLPVWNKVALQKEPDYAASSNSFGFYAGSDSATADIILPLTNNNTGLSGILMAHPTTDGYTISSYTIDQLYSVCHGNKIDTARATRELVLFFYLENLVFGTTKFYHIPAKLFPKSTVLDADGNKTINILPVTENNSGGSSLMVLEICVTTVNCPYPGSCSGENGSCDRCMEVCAKEDCTVIIIGGGSNGPTEIPNLPTGPPGTGGGSNPTGGGGTPPPCPGSVWYGFAPSGPCPNIPPPPPPPVYNPLQPFDNLNYPVDAPQSPIIASDVTISDIPFNFPNPDTPRSIATTTNRNNTEDMEHGLNGNVTGILPTYFLTLNNTGLEISMKTLFNFCTILDSDLRAVGDEMIQKFKDKTGGTYSNPILNQRVSVSSELKNFVLTFGNLFKERLIAAGGNINNVPAIEMGNIRPRLNGMYNKFHGLQILVNDTEYTEITLNNFSINATTGAWYAEITITIHDHFGLDKNDALTYQGSHQGFAAWWLLQHTRDYVPFETIITINKSISGHL